jgi:predicted  nucleic acid-binding Zn-ribbon protein
LQADKKKLLEEMGMQTHMHFAAIGAKDKELQQLQNALDAKTKEGEGLNRTIGEITREYELLEEDYQDARQKYFREMGEQKKMYDTVSIS